MTAVPKSPQRWTIRRKAAVIKAVRGGAITPEQARQTYALSPDELQAWERDLDRYGVPGLRTTRYQIYRVADADEARRAARNSASTLGD